MFTRVAIPSRGYADDTVEDLFGTHEKVPMRDRVCRAIAKVHGEIAASSDPYLPLMWTEWNVPPYGDLDARDNWYVGPALAHDISRCDGLIDMMSFWTFKDVFEEVVKHKPFDGGFGLIAPGIVKKPSFYDFALLHKLGDERLPNSTENVLVTRRKDGVFVIAAWNLVEMDKVAQGFPIKMRRKFKGVAPSEDVEIERVDETHGNPIRAYAAIGSLAYPTREQVTQLNKASAVPDPEQRNLSNGELEVLLPVNGLAVIEVGERAK
jgi:xylan 1,4-beta-xylosidase